MSKYKIELDVEGCIGCGACSAVSDNWEMIDIDGEEKAKCNNPDIEDDQLDENKEAADNCPVNVIHITNNETGERLI